MSDVEVPEYLPLTADQREAIRECRFKTTDQARTHALIYDADKARMEAIGCDFTAYRPTPSSQPERWDYEARSAHPEIVALVVRLKHGE